MLTLDLVLPVRSLADLLITVTILVVMFKKRTGWAVTDNLVKSLIRLTFGEKGD